MAVPYPSSYDIQQAILNPAVRFQDPVLKQSMVDKDPWGMPKVLSGNFALTFKLSQNGRTRAVRCFTRPVVEREQRYQAICSFLSAQKSKHFISTQYQSQGILVNGSWFPITVMDWVQGDTLENFVIRNISNKVQIDNLVAAFQAMIQELEQLKIAHGDLSHRNILVQNGKLILIDYDGMFVPSLRGQKSTELGSIYFQHPQRNSDDFNERLDRFSEIVIYLALKGLSHSPKFFDQFETGGEGLLFTKSDFVDPYKSPLLQALEKIPELQPVIANFRQICLSSINNVPRLEDLLNQKPIELPRVETTQHIFVPTTPYPAFSSGNREVLLGLLGQMISVIGQITDYKVDTTRYGDPYAFLNFGNWRYKCFTVVMWSETLDILNQMRRDPSHYSGKWVCVNGLVSTYKGRPQIIVSSPTDIEILKDEHAAQLRLNPPKTNTPKRAAQPITEPEKALPKIDGVQIPQPSSSPEPIMPIIPTELRAPTTSDSLINQPKSVTPISPTKTTQTEKVTPGQANSQVLTEKERDDQLNRLFKDRQVSNPPKPLIKPVLPVAQPTVTPVSTNQQSSKPDKPAPSVTSNQNQSIKEKGKSTLWKKLVRFIRETFG